MAKKTDALLHFLERSPTPWHAIAEATSQLKQEGFKELSEQEPWKLSAGGRYYVTRNGSSLCAFVIPRQFPTKALLVASHTDSPGFKLKPNAEFRKENMILLGVEIYGSPLLASWLNRDLGIAGRVFYSDHSGHLQEALVRLDTSPVILPQLALHLDRSVNDDGVVLNKQQQLAVLAALVEDKNSRESYLEKQLKKILPEHLQILSSDLFLFPLDPPKYVGEKKQMISGYRIDNLTTVHAGLEAICHSKTPHKTTLNMLALWDNEEIGSSTAQGAGSPFFDRVFERILLALKGNREDYFRLMSSSLCVSVDMAHALHPNYEDKHEPRHPLLMQGGIALKFSAQHRYASDAASTAEIVALCDQHNLPIQRFVTRGDIPAGTTIGPIHAAHTGMRTVDIGCPQLSMHSCRELAACRDYEELCVLLTALYGKG